MTMRIIMKMIMIKGGLLKGEKKKEGDFFYALYRPLFLFPVENGPQKRGTVNNNILSLR